MTQYRLFDREEKILRSGLDLLAADPLSINPSTLEMILKEYKRLLDRTKRLVTISDRFQLDLNASESRLQAIVRNSHDAIFIKDTNLRYLLVNPATELLFGVKQSAFHGKTDLELFGSELASDVNLEKQVLKGQIIEDEISFENNGNLKTLHIVKVPYIENGDKIAGVCGIARDISERKHNEKLRIQGEKYRAVADLSAGIAHNFNNLLQVIAGNAELCSLELDGGQPEVQETLSRIMEASQMASEMIRRLSDYSKSYVEDSGTWQIQIPLRDLVEEAVNLHNFQLEAQNKGAAPPITLEIPDNIRLFCNRTHIVQVIASLLNNAAESIKGSGKIDITGTCNESKVILQITDTGAGMPESDLNRIFTPFFTRKAQIGKGLSLSSARTIIEQHNGIIYAESSPGLGTRITIELPYEA